MGMGSRQPGTGMGFFSANAIKRWVISSSNSGEPKLISSKIIHDPFRNAVVTTPSVHSNVRLLSTTRGINDPNSCSLVVLSEKLILQTSLYPIKLDK